MSVAPGARLELETKLVDNWPILQLQLHLQLMGYFVLIFKY